MSVHDPYLAPPSPADIMFNRKPRTRMSAPLHADVRITGDSQLYKDTDKAKQNRHIIRVLDAASLH